MAVGDQVRLGASRRTVCDGIEGFEFQPTTSPLRRGLADELACVGFHFTAEHETFLEYTAHADAAAIYRVEPTVGNGDVWAAVRYDKDVELSSLLSDIFRKAFASAADQEDH